MVNLLQTKQYNFCSKEVTRDYFVIYAHKEGGLHYNYIYSCIYIYVYLNLIGSN